MACSWYASLAVSLLLIMVGLYTHWTVILAGAFLPFVPLVTLLLRSRRERRSGDPRPD
ncbi:MAG: hypothetical protein QNJ73_14520 [Gammaproteobacteria bacterium]|nr:hypothetical protein [Gammaproteobacteria bacterium]